MKRLILLVAFFMVTYSCSTTYYARLQDEKHFQAEGLTSGELIAKYGAPAREMSDGRDGRILVFTGDKVFNYPASKFGGTLPELQCYLDVEDICYRFETTNMESRKVFSFGKTLLLLILLGIIPIAA